MCGAELTCTFLTFFYTVEWYALRRRPPANVGVSWLPFSLSGMELEGEVARKFSTGC